MLIFLFPDVNTLRMTLEFYVSLVTFFHAASYIIYSREDDDIHWTVRIIIFLNRTFVICLFVAHVYLQSLMRI